jgi:hypothetical protein
VQRPGPHGCRLPRVPRQALDDRTDQTSTDTNPKFNLCCSDGAVVLIPPPRQRLSLVIALLVTPPRQRLSPAVALILLAMPVEIWLQIFSYLCTRDIVILSRCCRHLRHIAEDIRTQRQDINKLLADFVKDVVGSRAMIACFGSSIGPRNGGPFQGLTTTKPLSNLFRIMDLTNHIIKPFLLQLQLQKISSLRM